MGTISITQIILLIIVLMLIFGDVSTITKKFKFFVKNLKKK